MCYEMITSVRFCLSYDLLNAITFKMFVYLMNICIVFTDVIIFDMAFSTE